LEFLQQRNVVSLRDAVNLTELTAEKIETFARRHPDRVCYFGGEHPVMLAQQSRPYFVSCGTPQWTTYAYDALNRVVAAPKASSIKILSGWAGINHGTHRSFCSLGKML
jgi:hypothetical protein